MKDFMQANAFALICTNFAPSLIDIVLILVAHSGIQYCIAQTFGGGKRW